MFTHEDSRRLLIEWAVGEFKTAKVVIGKEAGVVGDHHHLNKDEKFLLLSGNVRHVCIGNDHEWNVLAMKAWDVPRGTYHLFELDEGSVLLGVATEEYDPDDEIPGR